MGQWENKFAMRNSWGSGFGELLAALANMQRQKELKSEGIDLFKGAVGESTTPQQPVTTDLTGRPLPQPFTGGMLQENYIDPSGVRSLVGSGNPFAKQMFSDFVGTQQAMAPKYFEQSPGTIATDVNAMSPTYGKSRTAPFKPQSDRKIGQGTVGGKIVAKMQKPDGTTYDIQLGESFEGERLKLAKQNLGLAEKRLEQSTDKAVKAEGKRLIDLFNKVEDQYNKNMIYLSDPNLAESTRQVLNEQQVTLANEMSSYGESINQLGQTTNEVLTGTPPKKTIKRTGKTRDGKKVIEYTDGTVEYQ